MKYNVASVNRGIQKLLKSLWKSFNGFLAK